MQKFSMEVPVISQALRDMGAPVSAITRAGSMLYTCGMPPIDVETGRLVSGDTLVQVRASLAALKAALAAADCSLSSVVKITIFVASDVEVSELNKIYQDFFVAPYPARTLSHVAPWKADFSVEIEGVASI